MESYGLWPGRLHELKSSEHCGPKDIEFVFFPKPVLFLSPILHKQKAERWAAACHSLEERPEGTWRKTCVGRSSAMVVSLPHGNANPQGQGKFKGSPGGGVDPGNLEYLKHCVQKGFHIPL